MKVVIHWTLISVLGLLALGFGTIALVPSWRTNFQNFFQLKQRTILATVRGQFIEAGGPLKAVKGIDSDGVFIEFFETKEDGTIKLAYELRTGHPLDGQFNYRGHMSRLVASDVDGDGLEELLVPTFDEARRPRLNVYKYQPSLNEFQEISGSIPVQ